MLALPAFLGVSQFALDRRYKPFQVRLDQIILRTILERCYRSVLTHSSRNENKRSVGSCRSNELQGVRARKTWHRKVGDYEVPLPSCQAGLQGVRTIHALGV